MAGKKKSKPTSIKSIKSTNSSKKLKLCAVLFSGGVDSTYVAAKLALRFDRLILLTYTSPGMINMHFSRRSAAQLQKLYCSKIMHIIIDIKKFITSIRGGIAQSLKDNLKYNFMYSWCLGCKLGMHLYTIQFCKENDIKFVADGSNFYDEHALEQHKDLKEIFDRLYAHAGITYVNPYYYDDDVKRQKGRFMDFMRTMSFHKDSTAARVKYLKEKGINLGKGFYSFYRKTQPSCILSLFFNGPRALLKSAFPESKKGCCKYIKDKIRKARMRGAL